MPVHALRGGSRLEIQGLYDGEAALVHPGFHEEGPADEGGDGADESWSVHFFGGCCWDWEQGGGCYGDSVNSYRVME